MTGMVDVYMATVLPNGMIQLVDRSTQMVTMFRVTAEFADGRIAIAVASGPEPREVEAVAGCAQGWSCCA